VTVAAVASARPLNLTASALEPSRAANDVAAAGAAVVVCVAAVLLVLLVRVLVGLRRPRDPDWQQVPATFRFRATDALAIAAAFALGIAALFAVLALVSHQRGKPQPTRIPIPFDGGGELSRHGGWTAAGFVLAIGAAMLVGAVALKRRRGRRHVTPLPAKTPAQRLGDNTALDPVAWELDPRKAVLQAYAVGERALASRDIERAGNETPREYLARVSAAARGAEAPLASLTGRYEAARFGHHEIGDDARRVAIDAAERLRAEEL
jgi:hypothetical protein